MSYEKLLDELETLQKGYAEADAKAAPVDNEDDDELDENGKPVAKQKHIEPDGDEGGLPMGKSFSLVDENGVETQAVDGTEFVKALHDRVESIDSQLGKAVTAVADMLKSQAAQIETLQKSVEAMSKQGVGRKSVLSVTEKPDTMAKSQQTEGIDGKEFMAKAMDAMKSGRISALEVSIAESSLNRGSLVRQDIVSRVMGNQ